MHVTTATALADLPADAWDALANPAGAETNPFVSHAFLHALEASGSATPENGWTPQHLTLRGDNGQLLAAAPCYRKAHSFGEYVFDHPWADALHRAGGRYYPKLQVAVPFSPVPGPRLLAPTLELRRDLLAALQAACVHSGWSSVHLTFLPEADARALAGATWLHRTDLQFHWHNRGYTTFDDYLAELSHDKRKQVRRERRQVREAGVQLRVVQGADLTEADWDAMFAFYQHTGDRKWGRPYLTRAFFSLLGAALPEAVVLVLCERAGRTIGGALHLRGSHALFGRYWGATEEVPCLHFEACYYQAIDYAIAHRLDRVEAGAQGSHKLARGYLPVATHSLHYLARPDLRAAVAEYLVQERAAVAAEALGVGRGPFRSPDKGAHDKA